MSLRRFLGLIALLLVGIAFLRSPPKAEAPKSDLPVEAPKPRIEVPKPVVELTPEQKAEQAAKKAREAEESAEFARYVLAVRKLRAAMKNPASFNLESANRKDDGTLCVSYRATNSFNAIIPGRAVVTKTELIASDDRDRFVPVWNRLCANKPGTSVQEIRYLLR